MIELTINGKKIGAEKGSTILQAALANGIKIPHLCYDKRVKPHGGCRLCIVEIEGQKKLEASCATLAAEGMKVWTDSPKVKRVRQTVLELILIHHPLDCPVCDKAGECDLQDLVFQYGKPKGRFVREKKNAQPYTKGPLLELNSNRCILCGKCVRLCAEHQCRGALGFIGRGFPTVVQPAFGEALQCDYCGQCGDVCPTGAIVNKSSKFKTRPWFLDEKDTVCPFCGCGCTLTLGTMDGKIVRSKGKEDRGVSKGDLCGRGRFGFDFIYSENRLKSPMIKKSGALRPASWDEAIQYIKERLNKLSTVYGPSSIGGIGSPRCTNEDNYVFQKFMRKVLGSNNIDSQAAFGYGAAETALKKAFGRNGHRTDLNSPLGKEAILVIESDLTVSHPVFGLNLLRAKREGSLLIVADSCETKLTRHSSRFLRIKQGTGVALLNGLMKVILDRKLFDIENAAAVNGYQEFGRSLNEYTLDRVCRITGITEKELVATAEAFAKAGKRMVTFSVGASENTKGPDTVLASGNLINLLGDSPDAIQIPAENANTFGLYQLGVRPDGGPFYTEADRGKGVSEMLYEPGSVKALYIMGADPAATFPDSVRVVQALKSLDLLIVQDIALTETAKLANVVLPASGWAEKYGTFTNTEGLAQEVCKVSEPPLQSLPDWLILEKIASAMGMKIGNNDRREIAREIGSLNGQYNSQRVNSRSFHSVHYAAGEECDEGYPLTMVLRDVLPHAGSISTRSKTLNLAVSEAILQINGRDARRLGIRDNGHVKVSSRRGSVYLKASVSENLGEGVVYVPAHFPHNAVTSLTFNSGRGGNSTDAVRIEPA